MNDYINKQSNDLNAQIQFINVGSSVFFDNAFQYASSTRIFSNNI